MWKLLGAVRDGVRSLDVFGGSAKFDASRYPKSQPGALISILVLGAAITLVVYNCVKLHTSVVAGDQDAIANIVSMSAQYATFNSLFIDSSNGYAMVADGMWDLPTLMLESSNQIEFYNKDVRKMYKIEIIDNNGNHRGLTSSYSDTPVASGLYKKVALPLGTANQDVPPAVGKGGGSFTLATSLGVKELHAGQEIVKVLEEMQSQQTTFFDHQVYLYVRIPRWQLHDLKMCQLQVSLANEGQYTSLLESGALLYRGNLSEDVFGSLSSSPSTWLPTNFMTNINGNTVYSWKNQQMTLLTLASNFSKSSLDAVKKTWNGAKYVLEKQFMDWRVQLTYLNNFLEVRQTWQCLSGGMLNLTYAKINTIPTSNDTVLQVSLPPGTSLSWPIPPFQIVLSMDVLFETVTVVDISQSSSSLSLTVQREKPLDFTASSSGGIEQWQCPLDWYNDSKVCDCECGAPDPDCLPSKSLPVAWCPILYSKVDTGPFCSPSGHCSQAPPTEDQVVFISNGCQTIVRPGSVDLVGYVGTSAEFKKETNRSSCVPCPGDDVYSGYPSLDSDGLYKCFTRTAAMSHDYLNPRLLKVGDDLVSSLEGASNTSEPNCSVYSSLWSTCMMSETRRRSTPIFARFARAGMAFPLVEQAGAKNVQVNMLLGETPVYQGSLLLSQPPTDDLQLFLLGPTSGVPFLPQNRFQPVQSLLLSAVQYGSPGLDVVVISWSPAGGQVSYRRGVDKNFWVRFGGNTVQVLEPIASSLSGLAARPPSSSSSSYFAPTCGAIVGGRCSSAVERSEGELLSLLLSRPASFELGRTSVVSGFAPCPPVNLGGAGGGDLLGNATNSSSNSTSRRLLQAAGACQDGVKSQLVLLAPLFPSQVLTQAQSSFGAGPSCATNSSSSQLNGSSSCTISQSDYFLFPAHLRPIVILRTRGGSAEVRLVNATQGNQLFLDSEVEMTVSFPATVETTFDGRKHACVPSHHPCVKSVYGVQLDRSSESFLPADRYQAHPSEPFASPSQLDLEVALFTVPNPEPAQMGGGAGGSGNQTVELNYLCPNKPILNSTLSSPVDSSWNAWTVRPERDLKLVYCSDTKIVSPACVDLGAAAADQTCTKAMPPTFQTDFSYSYPVNNKWEISQEVFQRYQNSINTIEYDIDVSVVYHLQYSRETINADKSFAESMNQGDYNDTNSFFLFNGALNFQGQGAGYDEYSKLSSLLPANHPVLKSNLILSVDSSNAVNDIMKARNATQGRAASLWPSSERDIKLVMEEFKPLQIDWELSSIGGRSKEQVIVLQPGMEYLLEALVQVKPVYDSNVWEQETIRRWERQVVSTAASVTPIADPNKQNQVIVRYHIQFDPLVRAQTFRKQYTVKNFADDFGAATGFIVFGAILLNCIRRAESWLSSMRHKGDPLHGEHAEEVQYARR